MKKTIFKRIVSFALVLIMTFAVIPMTEREAQAAKYTGVVRQTDSPWDQYYYGGGSLAGTGCGLFSLVNCVGYLTGELMDIPSLASWAYSTGGFNPNADGTYKYVVYPKVEAKYGAQYNITLDCNTDGEGWWAGAESTLLKTRLQQGYVAIGNVYNHFVAIVGYDPATNKYHVYDSAPRAHRGTNYNGGDVWLTQSQFSTGTMDLFWFCFVSLKHVETWQEKAAFDVMVYRDRNPDIAHYTDEELKKHWLTSGIKEGRASSPVLDLGFYYGNNKDLQDAFGKDYQKLYDHFINHGYKEKRKSSALFDGKYYCENNPEIYAEYGDNYMKHYAETGIKEGRRGSLTFDPDYYWVIRPDVWDAWPAHYEMCAKHYAGHGIMEEIEAYDNKAPVISNAVVSNVTSSGYTITCTVTDNWGIEFVSFPTWTTLNNQDDLAADFFNTQRGTKVGDTDTYTFTVKTSDHNGELGEYATHIYAKDKGGNLVNLELAPIVVKDGSLEQITLNSKSEYKLDGTVIGNVTVSTTVTVLLSQFENNNLKVTDKDGKELASNVSVGTGAKVNLYDGGVLIDSLTVVVLGDVDGNAAINGTDYMRVKSVFLGSFKLNDVEAISADFDGNSVINATDIMKIKAAFKAK